MKKIIFLLVFLMESYSFADLVIYPEYPSQIERDYAYKVVVSQGCESSEIPVYNHTEKSILSLRTRGGDVNRRFCEFAFSGGQVRIDVKVTEDVKCFKIFPSRHKLKTTFKEGVISVWLDKPTYFGIQLNDYDKTILSVFADKPEDKNSIPTKGTPGVLYVDDWLDAESKDGRLITNEDIKEIYIAPGAVLNARLVIKGDGTKIHGRGMVLDPLSNIFNYDQSQNPHRGVITVAAKDCVIEGVKIVAARTFCLCLSRADNVMVRDFKVLASMMCSDGISFFWGKNMLVDNVWIYVGDNALVIGGPSPIDIRNVVLGTSCGAIFPQSSFKGPVNLTNVDIFRADDGVINNTHNSVLRRNNKWNEMNAQEAGIEAGPQDLKHHSFSLDFVNLNAIDCTLFTQFFKGRNMGDLLKVMNFKNVSIPYATGNSHWRDIGKTNGVNFTVVHNPERYLNSSNYSLSFTNLMIGGRFVSAIPDFMVQGRERMSISVTNVETKIDGIVEKPCRYVVDWTCPNKVYVGNSLQRDWRIMKDKEMRLAQEQDGANLVEEKYPIRSIWQRVPSWMVKFEAMSKEDEKVVYHLIQCEAGAGMQAIITDEFLRYGNGVYRLNFDIKVRSENNLSLKVSVISNEKKEVIQIPIEVNTSWQTIEKEIKTSFDLEKTELISLSINTDKPTDDIYIKNISFVKIND